MWWILACSQARSPGDTGPDAGVDTSVPPPDRIVFNEVVTQNDTVLSDEHGDFDDYIELANPSGTELDLTGWGLSDGGPVWYFPEDLTVRQGGLLLVWCDKSVEQGLLHTSFKLSSGGEEISIVNPEAEDIELLAVPSLGPDRAYALTANGSWAETDPTPGEPNP